MYCPASSVPYATVEAELKGVYKRYCGLDRTGSLVLNEKLEVGQKCSSLQHWIHQWTNGNVLFSRLEGKLEKIYPKTNDSSCLRPGFSSNADFDTIVFLQELIQY